MTDELLQVIKQAGYWRVNIRPLEKLELTLTECETLVRNSSVQLRGWPFPFVTENPAENRDVQAHNNFVRGWIDAIDEKEIWQMYQSGQFIFFGALWEDLHPDYSFSNGWSNKQIQFSSGKYLNFVGSLTYFITEVFEFASRLTKSGKYDAGMQIAISLHDTKNRELISTDRYLSTTKRAAADHIDFIKSFTSEELLLENRQAAVATLKHFYERFNWGDIATKEVIEKDQDTLYGYKGF